MSTKTAIAAPEPPEDRGKAYEYVARLLRAALSLTRRRT